MNPEQGSKRTARNGGPFLYEWRRVQTVIGMPESNSDDPEWVEPVTFYRARVSPETLLNARKIRGSWHWALIHHSDAHTIVEGGTSGTLTQAKRAAESAARPFDNRPSIWEPTNAKQGSGPDDATGVPF